LIRSAALTIFLSLITPDAVVGYPALQQRQSIEQPPSHDVRCVLSIGPAPWQQNGPALVHIQLENLTDEILDLLTEPTFYLTNARTDYWSPTDIVQNKALDIRRTVIAKGKAVSIEPVPLKVHLVKHGLSDFQVDAAKTKWDKEISPIWPSFSLGTIPPGRYSLRLELSDTAGELVRSNEVTVLLEGKSDSEKK
jgi:hypothetical protein